MAEQRLFNRVVRVVAESLLVEGLRVQFKVTKSLAKEPNELKLSIYNLSQESRAKLQSKGTRVIVEAGYTDTIAQIFSGASRIVDHKHEGPDWVTVITCGDGETQYRYTYVSESFAAGTPVATVFEHLARATGLDASEASQTVRAHVAEQYTQGYAAHGRASAEIDRLLRGRGLEWSIQDGRLQVLREGAPTRDAAVLLSADTGLIGSPEHGTPHVSKELGDPSKAVKKSAKPPVLKAKSLLNAAIVPGGRVRVEAEAIQGLFRVQWVQHSGDTHSGDWFTEIEGVPL